MRKNLGNAEDARQIIDRLNVLTPAAVPLWGIMSTTSMLNHCNRALTATLEGKPSGKPSTIRQRALRFIFRYILPKFPKNVAAPKKLRVVTQIPDVNFEMEKQHCIDLIDAFANTKLPIAATHPVFGRLNTKEWGRFTWMHLDHHLRQFGR